MDPLFPPHVAAPASWIWGPGDPGRPNDLMRLFRASVEVPSPQGLQLRIAADSRYRLWVNGTWIGRGAAQSPPCLTYLDTWPLDGVVRSGRNEIAVAVYHLGTNHQARPALLLWITDAEGRVLLATGPSWRTQPDPSFVGGSSEFSMNRHHPFQERVDARRRLPDWQTATADPDRGWQSAHALSGRLPWTQLAPRHMPMPTEQPLPAPRIAMIEECQALERLRSPDLSIRLSQAGRPLQRATASGLETLAHGGTATLGCAYPVSRDDVAGIHDPCVLFDAGEVVTAFLELDVTSPEGAELSFGFAERLVDGRFTNALECWFAHLWTCRAGRQTIRFSAWQAFRYLRLRVSVCPTPLTLHAVRLISYRQPLAEPMPFSCADQDLERIRAISLASVRLCCVDGIYDTPFRESAQWLGDVALVTVPILQQIYGATAVVGQFLRQTHVGRTGMGLLANLSNCAQMDIAGASHIIDYTWWWVHAVRSQWMTTGDRRWVDHCWPGVLGMLALHRERTGEDGLAHDVPGWLFIDWAPVGRGQVNAIYHGIALLGLDVIAELASVRGDLQARAEAQALAAGIRRAFVGAFWDEARGCVTDGRGDPTLSEHANACALLAGVLSPAQAARVVEVIFRHPLPGVVEVEPFFMAVVLEALQVVGERELALTLLRHRYGRMLHHGVTSVLEEWGENGSWRGGRFAGFPRTHSHAWSACPATALIRLLGGIRVLEPTATRVAIDPLPTSYAWSVAQWTPHGRITVAWDGHRAQVTTPPGVSVAAAVH